MTPSTLITLIQCEECQNLFLSVDDMTLHPCCTKNVENKESSPTESENVQALSSSNDVEEMPVSTPKMEWSECQIKTLFAGYTKHQKKFYEGKFKNREIWEFVAKDLVKNGVSVTGEQCYNKWKSMLKHYNKTKMNARAGKMRRNCPYYDEMDEILNKSEENPHSKVANKSHNENLNRTLSEAAENEATNAKHQHSSGTLKRTKKIQQGRKNQQLSVYLMEYLKKREEIENKILEEERKADEERRERFKRAEYIAERKLELLERLVKAFES